VNSKKDLVTGPIRGFCALQAYLATYLLPFISSVPTHPTDIAAHAVYFAVVFVVYIRSDMAFVNAESGCWVTPRTWTR
jgi:hypothetical protein